MSAATPDPIVPDALDVPDPFDPAPAAGGDDDVLADAGLFDIEKPPPVSLADKFGWPPISILDRRSGPWGDRRRKWLSMGIQSELGRSSRLAYQTRPTYGTEKADGVVPEATPNKYDSTGEADGLLFKSASGRDPQFYYKKTRAEKVLGRKMSTAEFMESGLYDPGDGTTGLSHSGTSVFDPVLCELVYRWFSPVGGRVLDPFAGGSVRGIVASTLARWYVGIDLRAEQVLANDDQAHLGSDLRPRWIAGDSLEIPTLLDDGDEFDLVFSCPPYADLEVYSDDPRDLSRMKYPEFRDVHAGIIDRACSRLRNDRFAAWVISDVRGKDGNYLGLVKDTIDAFHAAGLGFYNDCVLVDPIGSGAMRAQKQFDTSRKVVRSHQHLLVFVKGDPRAATEAVVRK